MADNDLTQGDDRTRFDPDLLPDEPVGPAAGTTPQAVGETDADPGRRELRSAIGRYTSLASFPTTAGELADAAAANGAPDTVVQPILALAADTRLENARDLWDALGLEATDRF